jgi:hypothetical protein
MDSWYSSFMTAGDILNDKNPQKRRKVWMSDPPDKCQMCEKPIGDIFIDGRTSLGPWANMCQSCHRRKGVGLGTGKGQKYQRDPQTGEFVKIEG